MTGRRTFLAGLLGAPALPLLAITAPTTKHERDFRNGLLDSTITDIIHRAMRILGLLHAGERASQNDLDAARYALDQMLEAWASEGRHPRNEREIVFGLAHELALDFRVGRRI